MTIEVTTLAPRGEHLLDERIKDETLTSLMEPTWLITPEGQGMISGPENMMEENLADYIADREDEANQLNDLYMLMLENANKMGESFPGYLNSQREIELAQKNYDLFMKKYDQDMQNFEDFGEEKDIRDLIDDGLLDEMKEQKNILNEINLNHRRGIPSGEMQRLSKGGALRKITSSDNDPTIADFLATAAAGIVPGGLLVYGADRYGKRMDATEETPRPVSPQDQELVNQRIAELMMEEPVNEMRAVSPDMFERQKLGIERLLSNLYEPRRARDIAETISTAVDFSPAGIPTAVAEGIRMMGDDQPFMGAGMVALGISPFKGMPANKLKGLLKKADEKLDNLRTRQYQAESKMKGGLSKADFDEGFKESNKIQADINKTEKEIAEIKEALNPTAVPESGTKEPNFFQGLAEKNPSFKKMLVEGRKDAGYIKPVSSKSTEKEVFDRIMNLELSEGVGNDPKLRQIAVDLIKRNPTIRQSELDEILKRLAPTGTPKQVKGIINATPETQKLYQELLDSPSAINTPRHNKVGKDASEQLREIKKQVEESDLEDRNEVLRLLAQLRDKKPK